MPSTSTLHHGYRTVAPRSSGPLSRFLRAPFTADTWRRTAYGVLSLPLAAVCFALTMPGLIASTALLVVFLVGIPLFLLFFGVARTLAGVQRSWARVMLGADLHAPHPLALSGGPVRRWRARCGDSRTWREIAFIVLNLPFGLVLLFLCVYPWLQAVYSLSYPIVQWNTDFGPGSWGGDTWIGVVALHTLPGFAALFLGPWLILGATTLHGHWVRLMVGGRD